MGIRSGLRRLLVTAGVATAITATVLTVTPGAGIAGGVANGTCYGESYYTVYEWINGGYFTHGRGRTHCTVNYYRVRAVATLEKNVNGSWVLKKTGTISERFNNTDAPWSYVDLPAPWTCGQFRIKTKHVKQATSGSASVIWYSTEPLARLC